MFKLLGILIILVHGASCYAGFTTYMVGNSLSWDARPSLLPAFAALEGQTLESGYHIKCNSSLNNIATFAESTCVTPTSFGTFTGALQNNDWTAVSFQSFPSTSFPISTLATDQQVINDMIDLALQNPNNRDTKFFIYTGWPNTSNPYQSQWETLLENEGSVLTTSVRSYFSHLLGRIRADRPELAKQIFVLDTGEVLYQLDEKLRNGAIEGLSGIHDLYRDPVHLSQRGRFVSATSAYVSFTNTQYTSGVPEGLFDSSTPISEEFALLTQSTVYEVLSSNPTRTGVFLPGDMNGDGQQTPDDGEAFVLAITDREQYDLMYPLINPLYPGDFNGDNHVDFKDLGPFKELFGISFLSVPEPSSMVSLLVLLLLTLGIGNRRNGRP